MIYMNSEMAMMAQQHGHPGLALPPHIQPRPVSFSNLFLIYYSQSDFYHQNDRTEISYFSPYSLIGKAKYKKL